MCDVSAGINKMKSVIVFVDRELNANRESGRASSRRYAWKPWRDNAQPQHFLAWHGCQQFL
jgi:hypothetical protein